MVEAPVSYAYLKSTVPAAACEVAISVRSGKKTDWRPVIPIYEVR
jgi:hypothetical protein